ncbi:hypothetical protein BAUCODRAFT_141169 [Baudoinia panamericana UAMH 10762]|uniref:Uncharacterized protein n=1 Tax=Baudoinia panamericana (strain UAMH 10762) TaxID=717646 RepID=M2LHT3_BAUPA|nr:uncharacterized protein BAUCODRAFT_141169 [Baudoinia panamericana UAMH 10762]EMC93737.1 hypothetical protein BAUCODRAFT_141169 [Baudoinia panamericana UAMH 10762]
MAAKRAPSVCLACQARQALIGRRRLTSNNRRWLETAVLSASREGVALRTAGKGTSRRQNRDDADRMQTSVAVNGDLPQWNLNQQQEDVHGALEGLEILWREKDKRIRVLNALSNPWPEKPPHRAHFAKKAADAHLQLPEANAARIPHDMFRKNLAQALTDKAARRILRAQLLRCEVPRDIVRVIAVCLTMSRQTQQHIAALHEPIMRALYRCRNNVDDMTVLGTLNGIHSRYLIYGVRFDPHLLALGLKFAARSRSLRNMKRYLRAVKTSGLTVSSNIFRAVIAKFSIGHRGLGEIRNGRWKKSDLLEVLTGFDDCRHLPPEQQYHLGVFLDRSDWQYLHGWVAVLARCKATTLIWQEWLLWKQSDARLRPRKLVGYGILTTSRERGDYWFVEQMAFAGGLKEAWAMVAEIGIDFRVAKNRIQLRLLDGIEHCPESVWRAQGDVLRKELLRKYDVELSKIERAFSVTWVPTDLDDEAGGHHILLEDQEEVLERLGADDFKLEEDYGFPYETIVSPRERGLHDAAELGLVDP